MRKTNQTNMRLLVISIALACLVRLLGFLEDRLDVDMYYMIATSNLPYRDYTKSGGFGWGLMTYWWLSSRVFGESLNAHRIAPFLLQSLSVIVLAYICSINWSRCKYLCVFSCLFLAMNERALKGVTDPVISFSAEMLLGTILIGILLAILSKSISRREVMWLSLIMVPLAVFAGYTIIVPFCTGIFCLLMFQMSSLSGKSLLDSMKQTSLIVWPIMLIPAIQIISWRLAPFEFLGNKLLPHNHPFFLSHSGHGKNILGASEFLVFNSITWILGITRPFWYESFYRLTGIPQSFAYLVFFAFNFASIAVLFWNRKLDQKEKFVTIYFLVTWAAIMVGGLLSRFPYGTPRHTVWIIPALSFLIGAVFSRCWNSILKKTFQTTDLSLSGLVLALGLFGAGFFCCDKCREKRTNYHAMAFLNRREVDSIYLSGVYGAPVEVLAPAVGNSHIKLGFGSQSGAPEDLQQIKLACDSLNKSIADRSVQRIAVVAESYEQFMVKHEDFSDAVTRSFELTREIKSPSIWVGVFGIKAKSSPRG
jgi:hypothetical protein